VGESEAAAMVEGVRRTWVDTASLGTTNIRYLDEVLGHGRIVLGSDYPATSGVSPLESLRALGWDDDAGVMHENALGLFAGGF
jgi:predicted TIM-barrel fold metal-dependent hydrolase